MRIDFARAGFASDDVVARLQFERQVSDQGQILDAH